MIKEYKVQWQYKSGTGQFDAGDVIQIEEEQAAWFNHDSPGILVPLPDAEDPVSAEGRALSGPPLHRMITGEGLENRDFPEGSGELNATDAAIKLAEEQGIDLAEVSGSGADGRILKSDIEKLI